MSEKRAIEATMTTRAAFLKAPFQTELRERAVRALRGGEVLVEIKACGVCGTDLHFAAHAADEWQPFGHEIAGVVREVAPDVSCFRIGDRVALDSSAPCGNCAPCREGRALDCQEPQSFWGEYMGFAEELIAPQQCVYKVGDLCFETASLLEPLGVSIDLVQTADIQPGDRVLIIGPGPLGLMAIPLCFQGGASEVFLAGRSHSKVRMKTGKSFGAQLIETDHTSLKDHSFGSAKPNKILVTSPPQTLPEIFDFAAPSSIVAFIGCGFGPQSQVTFDADRFHFKRLQLRASMASPGTHGREALDILKGGLFDSQKMISHRFDLENISAALETAQNDKANGMKVLVTP